MRPRLLLRGVGKRYSRAHWVLRELELTVAAGELVSVRGANGVGKSTLLRIAARASRPTTGRVGSDRAGTRWVPDRVAVEPRLPVLAYLRHMGRIQGLSGDAATRRGADLLSRLDLVGGPDAPMGSLSKGSAQKVVLAQALLTQPTLLVLDEPWAGLDTPARSALAELLTEAADAGAAVVFTDHGLAAPSLRPTGYRLERGGLVPDGAAPAGDIVVVLSGSRTDGRSWTGWAGVDRVRVEPGRVRLDVRPDAVDDVLRAALASSWSVDRVEPGLR